MELSRVTTITWRTSIPFHVWRYSPFWALASLKACLHSSLFSSLLLHPLTPNSCNASLWTTSAHLVLGLPTGLVLWKVPFKTFFGILYKLISVLILSFYLRKPQNIEAFLSNTCMNPPSIRATCPAHLILLEFISQIIFSEDLHWDLAR